MRVTRRRFLKAIGALPTVPLLAACGSSLPDSIRPDANSDVPTVHVVAPNITLISATNLIRAIQAWNGGNIDSAGPSERFRISLQIIKARDDGGVTASGSPPTWSYFRRGIDAEAAAGRPADIAMLTGGIHTLPGIASPFFGPLNDFVQRDRGFLNEFVTPAVEATTFGGRVQAVPVVLGAGVMAWHPDRFDDTDLAPPSANWTWNDLASLGQEFMTAARARNKDDWWAMGEGIYTALWAHLMAQSGGGVLDLEEGRLSLTSDRTRAALQRWRDLAYTHRIMPTGADMSYFDMTRLAPRKRAALHHHMVYSGENIGGGWKIQNSPSFAGNANTSLYVMDVMGIHGKSVQTELAYEAIKALAPYVALRSMVPAWIPALKHVENPSGERPELALLEERVPVVLQALRNGRGTTTLPWTEIGTLLLNTMVVPIHKGELSVADATERATRAVANALPGVLV